MPHINESRATYEWVVEWCNRGLSASDAAKEFMECAQVHGSHTNESQMSHPSHIHESYPWVLFHVRMSHRSWISRGSHMKESCNSGLSTSDATKEVIECARVMSHILMMHVTHITKSCHTYPGVMSHVSMSHVTYVNESCHMYQWVVSHISKSHVTHINESCHVCQRVMSHVSHITESCDTYFDAGLSASDATKEVMECAQVCSVTRLGDAAKLAAWLA